MKAVLWFPRPLIPITVSQYYYELSLLMMMSIGTITMPLLIRVKDKEVRVQTD
jgi:hypothetical protein